MPCSAAWSATGPRIRVVPSASVLTVIPSNQLAQRWSRRPRRWISYQSSPALLVFMSAS